MTDLTPEMLRDFRGEVFKLLQKEHKFDYLIDIFELSGTSVCGEAGVILSAARVGEMLYPVPDGHRLLAVSDHGVSIGYLPTSPVLLRAVRAGRNIFMRTEYSADLEGIPLIIVSLWCK